ncbi:1,4-alpha-glucan branching protein GlgB [soil metagenome]
MTSHDNATTRVRHDVTLLTDDDLARFAEGAHFRLWEKLGAHPMETPDGASGTWFGVWAPNAREVSVIGDFNAWTPGEDSLRPRGSSGIWEGFVTGVTRGAVYKYEIRSAQGSPPPVLSKADPMAVQQETPPATASVVADLDFRWNDEAWMRERKARFAADAPVSVYEVHLGSWRRSPDDPEAYLSYRDVAPALAEYVKEAGFTHVELLPIMEHPFHGSWGYQVTGYFAPSSRYGSPQDLMALVDHLHQEGIGVILDWVPSHFPTDAHGPGFFDGTHLYEHADPRRGFHPDWTSFIFNYGRHEVRSFLMSSALYWLEMYHVDGIRVDGVASMLYLDYSREAGEWLPNEHGGRENLEAMSLLKRLNEEVYGRHPEIQTVAEESTSWPMVSRPTWLGGLGFGMKWDMGWMNDTLRYLANDPVHRRHHHDALTFRSVYAFSENFMLPLSHDEVVHGKGSLLTRMPGDEWQKFANLRLLFGYMFGQPGKKLIFMGGEFGQVREWDHDRSLDWHLLEEPLHEGVRRWVADLNRVYRAEPALHELDFDPSGFEWVDASDADQSVLSFLRIGPGGPPVLVVCNFTPVTRPDYRIGVPRSGAWEEILNGDAEAYGGSGVGNLGEVASTGEACHGRPDSVVLTLPPLAAVFLKGPAERAPEAPEGALNP